MSATTPRSTHRATTPGTAGQRAPARPARPARPAARGQAPLDEAQAAVSQTANTLRDVRERYRVQHQAELERWNVLRAELAGGRDGERTTTRRPGAATKPRAGTKPGAAANAGTAPNRRTAANARTATSRTSATRDEAVAAGAVGTQQAELARLELAIKALENAWLFLEPNDQTLVGDGSAPASAAELQMRIVEAQEAERNRLAREVHDGPAQALANGIFQIEIVERLLDRDERLARQELRNLRDMLTRELRGVRAYLSQLRPPLLADLGLAGAIREAAEQIGSVIGVPVDVEVDPEIDALPEAVQVVILRVIQEALQNVRKHAQPRTVRVRAVRDGTAWLAEVRDDGVGFDPAAGAGGSNGSASNGGRRSFGLQFMRERAELIGGRFEVRSGRDLGTVVRLVVPGQEEEAR